ncbi:CDP-diacylglycerol--glycerol-3-phosphate 3-phosphatidyltransferase [Carnobacteriaceae bacterium zg-C25]|nr:CDP-diacylglycerol--glycerol-3-phosphate 3-phosphatidyltransferase [Carnobacteriaceae bacterium zg-C25]
MNIANKLTIARLIAIPFFIVAMLCQSYFLAGVLFVVASATDYLDGYLARRLHLVTNFGKFADPLADKMLVLSALIMLVQTHGIPAWIVSVIIMRELAVTGLRLLLIEQGTVMAADWSGKLKTATQMIAITCLIFNDFSLGVPLGNVFLYICLALTIYSGIDYFIKYRSIFNQF